MTSRRLLCLVLACCAPVAPSLAKDSTQIYGRLEGGLESFDNGAARSSRMESYSSRLGYRGREYLSADLYVFFQLEYKIAIDVGSSTGMRDSFLGIAGNWGQLRLGFISTPFKELDTATCIMAGNGDVCDSVLHRGVNSNMNFHTRQSNALEYASPKFAGFSGSVMLVPDEEKTATLNRMRTSGALNFSAGGLALGAVYEVRWDDEAPGRQAKGKKLSAGYDFGDGSVGLAWSQIASEGKGRQRDAWLIAAAHKLGPCKVRVSYVRAGESLANGKDGAQMWAAQLDYPFSKRSTLYTYYTALENGEKGDKYVFQGSSGSPSGPGANMSLFALALRHVF